MEEFTPIFRKLKKDSKNTPKDDELAACLANFDREGNGLIPTHELKFLLTNCGWSISTTSSI
jgi:Ca2+-binding EF-hand superfamily protein